jgi:hypothetical protein
MAKDSARTDISFLPIANPPDPITSSSKSLAGAPEERVGPSYPRSWGFFMRNLQVVWDGARQALLWLPAKKGKNYSSNRR